MMPVTQQTHWKTTGTEPTAGVDDEYVVNGQPIAEHDNWINYYLVDDITNALTALQDTTVGHDHDGVNSKTVDASDIVNTPAGTISATDVQAAVTELDSKSNSSNYAGDSTVNRAIPHGLSSTPKQILITNSVNVSFIILPPAKIIRIDSVSTYSVTSVDSTNFYVGNASSYSNSANVTASTYDWVAIA